MPSNAEHIEKRQFRRLEMSGHAMLFFGKDYEVSETLQISEGGMMTTTMFRLTVGDEVTIHFTVGEMYLRARAQVIYMVPVPSEEHYKVGLRFKNLLEEYRSVIREFTK
jgi:hypothetical protein